MVVLVLVLVLLMLFNISIWVDQGDMGYRRFSEIKVEHRGTISLIPEILLDLITFLSVSVKPN